MQTLLKIIKRAYQPKNVGRVVLAVFATVTLFGIFLCTKISMPMDMVGPAIFDCGMMTTNAACPMSIVKHLTWWSNLFVAPPNTSFLSLLLIVVGLVAPIFFISKLSASPPDIVRSKNYPKEHRASTLYNYLITIFADGILQPKLLA